MRSERACLWIMLSSFALTGVLLAGSDVTADQENVDVDVLGGGGVSSRVLSRKRRYLTFPEGSSLQVVYDQTIPIIGIPLLYTIGVTVAIAYELPSKPWYHYIKDIRKNLQTSAYLLRKDQNVSQLTYTDQGHKPSDTTAGLPAKTNLLNVVPTYNYNPIDYNKHSSYYYKNGAGVSVNPLDGNKQQPWSRIGAQPPISYYTNPVGAQVLPPAGTTKLQPVSNKLGYYFGKPPNQLASVGNQLSQWMKYLPMNLNPKQPIYWSDVVKGISKMATKRKDIVPVPAVNGGINQSPIGQQQPPIKYGWRKGHKKAILPVFGKRSVDNHMQVDSSSKDAIDDNIDDDNFDEEMEKLIEQEEQRHFTRHHRQTRHDLYSKIEVYLNSKGLNGRECVLRTLCETGHKHQAHHLPNTFVAEIIKTIFRLPKSPDGEEAGEHQRHQRATNEVHNSYDRAHQSNANCTDLYPECKGDLWNHPFLY